MDNIAKPLVLSHSLQPLVTFISCLSRFGSKSTLRSFSVRRRIHWNALPIWSKLTCCPINLKSCPSRGLPSLCLQRSLGGGRSTWLFGLVFEGERTPIKIVDVDCHVGNRVESQQYSLKESVEVDGRVVRDERRAKVHIPGHYFFFLCFKNNNRNSTSFSAKRASIRNGKIEGVIRFGNRWRDRYQSKCFRLLKARYGSKRIMPSPSGSQFKIISFI